VEVVRPTAQLNVLDRRRPADGIRLDVMKLEKPAFGAAARAADECTLPAIAFPHVPPNRRWDMSRTRRHRPTRSRVLGCGVPDPFDIRQQHRQRAIDDRGDVAVRNRVAEQVLEPAQLVVGLTRHADLNLVAFRRGRD
jgi:hypothetical protein